MRTLKNLIYGVITTLALTTAIAIAAQDPQATTKPADITVTGCVTQGSQPTLFVLDNARMNPDDQSETGKRYVLMSIVEGPSVKDLLNHEVKVTGVSAANNPSLPEPERNLDVLTAKALTSVADRCVPSAR